MTLLLILWWTALLVMLASVAAGFFLFSKGGHSDRVGERLGDIFAQEIRSFFMTLNVLLRRMTPHGRRAFSGVSTQGLHLRDRFMKWIFGKIARPRGRTSSFFLKHLAEHQETLRRGLGEKQGY